jgi:GAF domain-containing protein
MVAMKKLERYIRIEKQLADLLNKSSALHSKMATVNAVLYHKMDGFFWVGFYLLNDGLLQVGPYQGPLACLELPYDKGVCWASIKSAKSIIVNDVHAFPGHIACDSRSKSEIVIPLKTRENKILGVLDIDSNRLAHFDETDREELEKIVALVTMI